MYDLGCGHMDKFVQLIFFSFHLTSFDTVVRWYKNNLGQIDFCLENIMHYCCIYTQDWSFIPKSRFCFISRFYKLFHHWKEVQTDFH